MDTKKCIVLDLDNTIWGGIVGEDGYEGIKLSLSGTGAGFIAFQQALLDLYNKGVILAICSKNNYEDAIKVIKNHPNMILKENNFAAMQINWNDKVSNLKELAKEINVGLDSMVFLDDDPTNRAQVRALLPQVETPEMPSDSSDYAKFLIRLPYFALTTLTDEDKMRGNLYVTERLRRESEKSFNNQEDFLKSLGLELQIFIDDSSQLARLSQLTGKTNQFNFNKRDLSEKDIMDLVNNSKYQVFYGGLADRFGDYGIIGFAITAKRNSDLWHIDQFLMSCRAIGRGVEEAFLAAMAKIAKDSQVKKLSIAFSPTEKNKPAKYFLEKYFKENPIPIDDVINSPNWIVTKFLSNKDGKIQ
ncbi:MAG: HAD-IIIC family phosphatase [Patescibacteria group bacterium]